ncbi:MAG: PilZ domain protein [Acidobacteria bacterium OLB17]|nr:MAG: PilZ domain protein [Acidobacteria bacterium OLB17]
MRASARQEIDLKAIVQVTGDNEPWKEITPVTSISRNGAGFTLTQPCVVGRLIQLTMPLADELRAYDKGEKVYQVVGVVQFCNRGSVEGSDVYHIGVGFIGKTPPESHLADPAQGYRIIGMHPNGLWRVIESATEFTPRKSSRFWMSIPMTVSRLKGKLEKTAQKEDCLTQNISTAGVSVLCSLPVKPGERVKVASEEFRFYSVAIVRNRKERKNQLPTLHLEFVDQRFPTEKMFLADNRLEAEASGVSVVS